MMNFSRTEVTEQLTALAEKLPEYPLQEALTARLVRLTAESMSENLNQCLKGTGINENMWLSLLAVYLSPNQEIMPSRLSDILNLTRTSATRLSDEMVDNKWVTRRINEYDRRQIVLSLTREGERLIKQIQPMLNEKRSGLWAGFSEKDHRELQRLLGKLLDKLNK